MLATDLTIPWWPRMHTPATRSTLLPSGAIGLFGDRLGLYEAMAGVGPITSPALEECTGTTERCVSEWLGNQAAGGYVICNLADGFYELPVARVLPHEDQ